MMTTDERTQRKLDDEEGWMMMRLMRLFVVMTPAGPVW